MLSPLILPVSYNEPSSSRRLPSIRCPPPMPPSVYPFVDGSSFDDVARRLQLLAIPSRPHSPARSSPSIAFHPPSPDGGQCILESPFTYSWPDYRKDSQDELPPIDSFTPCRPSFDLSPTSSTSSDLDLSMPSYFMSRRSSFDAFFATQSRVVRVSSLASCLELPFLIRNRSYLTCLLRHGHSSLHSFKM